MPDKLIRALENYFGNDSKRINHAKTVLKYAVMFYGKEGGDESVIIPTALLHDVGIKAAEAKYNSSAGNLQEQEGPSIAKEILQKIDYDKNCIDEICAIISKHHTPGAIDSINFKIIMDADLLTNIIEEGIEFNEEKIKKKFITETGCSIAKRVLKGEKL